MDTFRNRLIAKVDEILNNAVRSADTHPGSEIQIEARLISPHDTSTDCVILEAIKLEDLRKAAGQSHDVSTTEPGSQSQNRASCLDYSTEQHDASQSLDSENSHSEPTTVEHHSHNDSLERTSRRKVVGGLRPTHPASTDQPTPPRTPSPPQVRQLESDERSFPKRRKTDKAQTPRLEQSTLDKLIEGIWEQIHNPRSLAMSNDLEGTMQVVLDKLSGQASQHARTPLDFDHATRCCQQITTGSRTFRALEVIVQAYFVDCYDSRIVALAEQRPDLRPPEHKKMVLTEACKIFSWSEKELRNRMAIWKGYREIKNAAGWSALIFAGPGIYRFCKYRMGFEPEDISRFQSLRTRAEVAADTIQPQWRQLLKLVGEPTQLHYRGHPHDWAVGLTKRREPLPIAHTYRQWDPRFSFTHLEDSLIDKEKWGDTDPRRYEEGPQYYCRSCSLRQSAVAEENECECFPDLYSPNPRTPRPLQVFQTENGRNNGLIACCVLERGSAVGEFAGLITKDLADVDVMQSQAGTEPYQIWQGRYGNYTRFINHSCQPNCQFQTFSWLGIQRIIVVSKGVPAGKEVTVDYSGRYWQHLDKVCLCGEPACRYRNRSQKATS